MPDWLRYLAQSLFWVVAMTFTMRWLARSRQAAHGAGDGDRLRHPGSILAIGIVGGLFFVGIMVAATFFPDEGVGFLFYGLMGALTLQSFYMVADYYNARHAVSGEGMDFGRPTGRRLVFRWSEVERVRFSRMMKWFRVELRSGEVVRVSFFLMGLPAFAAQVLRQVPEACIDKEALQALRETANGQLPKVWG